MDISMHAVLIELGRQMDFLTLLIYTLHPLHNMFNNFLGVNTIVLGSELEFSLPSFMLVPSVSIYYFLCKCVI
jgi:hypothetical protein